MRKAFAITVAAAAVLVITGCTPRFVGPIKGKQISDEKVQVKFKICQREFGSDDCSTTKGRQRGDTHYFHLIAVRVPRGTKAPELFRNRGGELIYERSPSYAGELRELAPTPNRTRWFGYISEDLEGQQPDIARYKLKFKLPDDPGDEFKYRPVTGYAFSEGTTGEPPRVECGDHMSDPSKESNPNASCVTDPTKRRRVRKSKTINLD